jgi:DNA invertase Pin-like site-specific DNA recombinase
VFRRLGHAASQPRQDATLSCCGPSAATQRTIAGYATMHGLTIDKVFVERGVSGSKPLGDRPQGAALLEALKPGDVVITPKLDRMFRSALDALDVLAKLKAGGIAWIAFCCSGSSTSAPSSPRRQPNGTVPPR